MMTIVVVVVVVVQINHLLQSALVPPELIAPDLHRLKFRTVQVATDLLLGALVWALLHLYMNHAVRMVERSVVVVVVVVMGS